MRQRILITGANRGLGLEFARHYSRRGERVFCACRQPDQAAELTELQRTHPQTVHLLAFDAAHEPSIRACAEAVAALTDALDLLISNAGIYSARGDRNPERLGELAMADALRVFSVNAAAPVLLAQACLGLLRNGAHPRLVHITSGYASVSSNSGGYPYHYSASKAALNMYTRSLAGDLRPLGITAVVISPGWVRTDMGGPSAPLSPEESVQGMVRVIDGLTLNHSGEFLDHRGRRIPW